MACADSGNTKRSPSRHRFVLEFQATRRDRPPTSTSDSPGSAGPRSRSISSALDVTQRSRSRRNSIYPQTFLNTRCPSWARPKFSNLGSPGTCRSARGGEPRREGVTGGFIGGAAAAPGLQQVLKNLNKHPGAGWERML